MVIHKKITDGILMLIEKNKKKAKLRSYIYNCDYYAILY